MSLLASKYQQRWVRTRLFGYPSSVPQVFRVLCAVTDWIPVLEVSAVEGDNGCFHRGAAGPARSTPAPRPLHARSTPAP